MEAVKRKLLRKVLIKTRGRRKLRVEIYYDLFSHIQSWDDSLTVILGLQQRHICRGFNCLRLRGTHKGEIPQFVIWMGSGAGTMVPEGQFRVRPSEETHYALVMFQRWPASKNEVQYTSYLLH